MRQESSCWLHACRSHCVPHCLEKKISNTETIRKQKKPLWCTPGFKRSVMFCSKGSTVLPGSVLSPLCDLCSLHPLWWAWFCCNTFHSTESAEFVSLPAQFQTPARHQKRKQPWTHHSRTLLLIINIIFLKLTRREHFWTEQSLLPNSLEIS